MRPLNGDDVNALVESMISGGLGLPDRDNLFAGVDKRIKSGLKVTSRPDDQFRSDIEGLNEVSSRHILRDYLNNGSSMVATNRGASALLTYAARYVGGMPGPNPASVKAFVEVLFEGDRPNEPSPTNPTTRGLPAILIALAALAMGALSLYWANGANSAVAAAQSTASAPTPSDVVDGLLTKPAAITKLRRAVLEGVELRYDYKEVSFNNSKEWGTRPNALGASMCALTMVDDDNAQGSCQIRRKNGHWEFRTGDAGGGNQCKATCVHIEVLKEISP